ncbi:MAG: hypothetical protein LBF59_06420 [Prevotellaceae bacterium]|nr:hypothetical protein [Prevotellaceae bacterium]
MIGIYDFRFTILDWADASPIYNLQRDWIYDFRFTILDWADASLIANHKSGWRQPNLKSKIVNQKSKIVNQKSKIKKDE